MSPTYYEMSKLLREELKLVLQGPGVTWNLNGILSAYDRATAAASAKIVDKLLRERA